MPRAFAGFWQRVAARLLDGLLIGLAFVPSFLSVFSGFDPDVGLGLAQRQRLSELALYLTVVGGIYEVVAIAVWGKTIGKLAVGIKVVRFDDGGQVGWGQALARWALPGLVGRLPALGPIANLLIYLWMLWDPNKQGLHDKVAGTIVIRTR